MQSFRFNFCFMFFLILSFVFLLPINISQVFGAENVEGNKVVNTREEFKSICNVGKLDVKDSFFLSALSLCLPGILEKVYEYKVIKCDKIACKYDAVVASLDPSFCEEQEAIKVCEQIYGELFALPFFKAFKDMKNMIKNVLANPVGIITSVATITARITITGSCSKFTPAILCNVATNVPLALAAPLVISVDLASVVQTLKSIQENGVTFTKPEDSCDRLDEIKDELEEVLGELEEDEE